MRILVASDQWFPDFKGGVARVATGSARHLADRGHEVTVLVPRSEKLPSLSTEGTLTVLRVLRRSVLPQTVTDIVASYRRARSLTGDFDVALAHQATTAVGLRAALPHIPLVFGYYAPAWRELRLLRVRAHPLRRAAWHALEPWLRVLEGLAIRRAQRVLMLSRFSEELFLRDHPDAAAKARLVLGGVDTRFFTPNGKNAARRRLGIHAERLLVSVRRLEPRMGLEELVRAVSTFPRSDGVSLVIVGDGPLRQSLRFLAQQLEVDGIVTFRGEVSDAELLDWYRAADLFVLPTTAHEGFGMVTVEALAVGTPVVGTPVGATPELLAGLEPRLITEGTDPAALARAIRNVLLLADDELGARCAAYARERFDWRVVIAAWEQTLEETFSSWASSETSRHARGVRRGPLGVR